MRTIFLDIETAPSQRADIREYLDEDTPFPERESTETSYKLTPEYKQFFDDVMAFVRKQVHDPTLSATRQRVRSSWHRGERRLPSAGPCAARDERPGDRRTRGRAC